MAQSTNNPELVQAFIDARNPQSNNPNIQEESFTEEVGPPPVNNVLAQKNIKAQQLAIKLNALKANTQANKINSLKSILGYKNQPQTMTVNYGNNGSPQVVEIEDTRPTPPEPPSIFDRLKNEVSDFVDSTGESISNLNITEFVKSAVQKYGEPLGITWDPTTPDNSENNQKVVESFVKEYGEPLGISIPPKPPSTDPESAILSLLNSIFIAEGKESATVPFGQTHHPDFKRRIALGETIPVPEARDETVKFLNRHIKRWEEGGTRSNVDKAEERGLINANPGKSKALTDGRWNPAFLKWFGEIYAPTHSSIQAGLTDAEKAKNVNWLGNVTDNLGARITDQSAFTTTGDKTAIPLQHIAGAVTDPNALVEEALPKQPETMIVDGKVVEIEEVEAPPDTTTKELTPPQKLSTDLEELQPTHEIPHMQKTYEKSLEIAANEEEEASSYGTSNTAALEQLYSSYTTSNAEELERIYRNPSFRSNSPIVAVHGNVIELANGTYRVLTGDGKFMPFSDKMTAQAYAAYDAANWQGKLIDAPQQGELGGIFNKVMGGLANPLETVFQGYVGAETLTEHINDHNNRLKAGSFMAPVTHDPNDEITRADKLNYLTIQESTTLTPELQAFKDTDKYKKIAELDAAAKENVEQAEAIREFAKEWEEKFPHNRKHIAGASAMLTLMSEKHGDIAGLIHMLKEDKATWASQGFDSFFYSTMLMAGGWKVKALTATNFSRGRAKENIREYVRRHGEKALTPEILGDIKLYSTFQEVSQMVGMGVTAKYIAKVPGFGGIANWSASMKKGMDKTIHPTVLGLGEKVVAIPKAHASEFVQGAVEEGFRRKALDEEFDPGKMAVSGVQEAAGLGPLAITSAATGTTIGIAKAGVKKALEPSAEKQAADASAEIKKNLTDKIKKVEQQLEDVKKVKETSPQLQTKVDNLNTQISEFQAAYDEIENIKGRTIALPGRPGKLETQNTLLKKLYKAYEPLVADETMSLDEALEEMDAQLEAQLRARTEERTNLEKQLPKPIKLKDTRAKTGVEAELAGVEAEIKKAELNAEVAVKSIKEDTNEALTEEKKEELIAKQQQIKEETIAPLVKQQGALTERLEKPVTPEILKFHEQSLKTEKEGIQRVLDKESYKVDPTTLTADQEKVQADFTGTETGTISDGDLKSAIADIQQMTEEEGADVLNFDPSGKFKAGDVVTIDTENPELKDSEFVIDKVLGKQERDGKVHVKIKGIDETIPIDQLNVYGRAELTPSTKIDKVQALVNRELTDEQKEEVRKILATEVKELEKRLGEGARVLGSSEDSQLNIDKLTEDELKEKAAKADSDADKKFWKDKIEQKRIQKERAGKEAETDKTLATVHSDILEGKGKKWKGLHSYYNEIIAALQDYKNDPVKRNKRLKTILPQMRTHAANLASKLAAFEDAASRLIQSGKVAAVVATRTKDAGGLRSMDYKVVTDMTQKQVEDAQKIGEYNGEKAYITQIGDKSKGLIDTLKGEAEYGKYIMGVVTGYENTSMNQKHLKQLDSFDRSKEVLAKLKEALSRIPRVAKPITDPTIKVDTSGKIPTSVLKARLKRILKAGLELKGKRDKLDAKPEKDRTKEEENELKQLNEELESVREEYRALRDQIKKQEKDDSIPKGAQFKLFEEGYDVKGETPASDKTTPVSPDASESAAADDRQTTFLDEDRDKRGTKGEQLGLFRNFIESSTRIYKRTITPELIANLKNAASNLENQLGLAGAYFTDLVQIGSRKGKLVDRLNSLKDTDFATAKSLIAALIKLGVSEESAKILASNYAHFKGRYENILYKEISRSDVVEWVVAGNKSKWGGPFTVDDTGLHVDESGAYHTEGLYTKLIDSYGTNELIKLARLKDEDRISEEEYNAARTKILKTHTVIAPTRQLVNIRNFALQQPLTLLLQEDLDNQNTQGKLPDQVVFTLMLTVMTVTRQHPNNNRWHDKDFTKGAFLYGGKPRKLNNDEDTQVRDLGYGLVDISEGMGRDAISLLDLSAKKIAENSPISQAGADLYFEQLGPALGLMAAQIAQGTDDAAYFSIEEHFWNFDDYVKDRNFNNAPTHWAHNEKNPYLIDGVQQVDGDGKPIGRPISPEKIERYRHIKMNDIRLSKEAVIALDEIIDVSGADIDPNPGTHQTPPKVDEKIKGTFTITGEDMHTLLKQAQTVKWKKSQSMDIVADLRNEPVLQELLDIEEVYATNENGDYIYGVDEKGDPILDKDGDPVRIQLFHDIDVQSKDARNRDKLDTLDELLGANDRGELNGFHIKYQLQGHHRLMQVGRISPQNSKVTRALVDAWGLREFSDNNIDDFKLAVAQSLSIKVTKKQLLTGIAEFERTIDNQYILEAVEALQRLNAAKKASSTDKAAIKAKERAVKDFAAAVSKVKREPEYRGANLTILNAINALSQYMTVEAIEKTQAGLPNKRFKRNNFKRTKINPTFKSDISGEIDGVSNGWAMNVFQFPMWEKEQLLERNKQVGVTWGMEEEYDPTEPGVYEDLIDYIQKGMAPEVAWEWYKKNNWKDDFPKDRLPKYEDNSIDEAKFKKEYTKLSNALNILYPDFKDDESLRDVAKYPFIMKMYGSGMNRVAKDVTNDIVKAIYSKLSTIQNEYKDIVNTPISKEELAEYDKLVKTVKKQNVSPDAGVTTEEGSLIQWTEALEAGFTKTQLDYERTVIKPFMNALEALGAFKQTATKAKDKVFLDRGTLGRYIKEGAKADLGRTPDSFKTDKGMFDEKQIEAAISTLIAPRFNKGLDTLLEPTEAPRKAIIEMGEMLHWTFITHYEEAYEKKLAEINGEYTPDKTVVNITHKNRTWIVSKNADGTFDISSTKPDGTINKKMTWVAKNRDRIAINKEAEKEFSKQKPKLRNSLTKQELYDLITDASNELRQYYPQIAGPLATIGENGEVIGGIDISDTIFSHKSKGSYNIEEEGVQITFTDPKTGKKRTSNSLPSQLQFVSAGVAVLIRQVINVDAVILAKTMMGDPGIVLDSTGKRWAGNMKVVPIYDGFIASAADLPELSESYSTGFTKYNMEHSIMDASYRTVLEVFRKTEEKDKEVADKHTTKAIEMLELIRPGIVHEKGKLQYVPYKLDGKEIDTRKVVARLRAYVKRHDLDIEKVKMNFKNAKLDKKTKTRLDTIKEYLYNSDGLNNARQKNWEKKTTYNDLVRQHKQIVNDVRKARALRDSLGKPKSKQMFWPAPDNMIQVGGSFYRQYQEAMKPVVEAAKKKRKANNKQTSMSVAFKAAEEFKKNYDENHPEQMELFDTIDEVIEERKLHSLDSYPKEVEETEEKGDLDSSSARVLFNEFGEHSSNYYDSKEDMDNHTSTLSEVLDIVSEGFEETKNIRLTYEQISGVTQAEYEPESERMTVSVTQHAPFTRNGMSPQEVYVHEIVHSMTFIALEEYPGVADRLETLYAQVEDSLNKKFGEGMGWKVFRPRGTGPTDLASSEEVEMAKKQYRHAFHAKEEDRLHEFLSFALTNQQLVEHMKKTDVVKKQGLLNELLAILKFVVDSVKKALNYKVYEAKDSTSLAEAIAITEHLIAVQNKHKSKQRQLKSKTPEGLRDKADRIILDFVKRVNENMATKINKMKFKNKGPLYIATGLAHYPRIMMSDNAEDKLTRDSIMGELNFTLRGIAKELGGGALGNDKLVEQLLHAKVNISKERRGAETFTIKWFEEIWRSRDPEDKHWMSFETREALTDVLLKADLSSLRLAKSLGFDDDPSSTQKILNLLGNDNPAAAQRGILKNNIKKILKVSADSAAIRYAEELGRFIATGKTKGNMGIADNYMNAYSIALDHLKDPTEEQVNLLDAFITIAAIDHLDGRQKTLVKGLSDREFKANAKENGMIDLLDTHIAFKAKSRRDNFDGDPIQMVKGYIVERMDNLTDIRIGPAADKEKMNSRGYTESYPLGKVDKLQTNDTLYINRNIAEVADISGIMSTTNQRNMGTTLTEILLQNDAYMHPGTGKPNFVKIKAKVESFKQYQGRLAKEFKINDTYGFRPVRDRNNVITDYRVMMDHQSTKEFLKPDLEIQNVLAHMESGYVDRKATIENDKETIDILIHEQEELLDVHPDQFVDILDPDGPYIDRYRKLPRAIRNYIQDFAEDGKFMVRHDIIDKVFGYKQMDISQLKLFDGDTWLHQRAKQVAGLAHYGIRQTVAYGKNRIVLAMPKVVFGNMFSNVNQLLMRKIPFSYIVNKTIEGINEYSKYKRDSEELAKLEHLMDTKKLDKETSPEGIKAQRLRVRLERNKIHKMNEAGLDSLIVEDINEAQVDGYWNRMKRTMFKGKYKKIGKLIPQELQTVASWAFWTKGSAPYQASRRVVQMTDFIGRYVMIEHAVNIKGQAFKPAMHDSLNAFVLFDESLIAVLEALDAIGLTAFLSYYLRNTRSAKQMIQNSPSSVAMSAAVQHITGIPTLGNINSSWLGGNFTPNMWQTPNLFDEANNVTTFEAADDLKGMLFN